MTDKSQITIDWWFWALLAVGAIMRLSALDSVPPGLSADEASNAYDAYCLLETGQDRWQAHWPIVLRAFGDADYRPALNAYLIVPFLWILGPANIVVAARLPAAICGILTVACLYAFMRRQFGPVAARISAALLIVQPWHAIVSRLAHESALTPIFAPLLLWLLSKGGFPLRSDKCRWRTGWLVAAGAVAGLSQYTYASLRLFIPALLCGLGLLYSRRIANSLKTDRHGRNSSPRKPSGRLPLACFFATALLVAGPMVYVTCAQWHRVNARAQTESLFHNQPTVTSALTLTAKQYAEHFGPDWLFINGHPYVDQSPRGFGQLSWPMAVLLPMGLVALITRRSANGAFATVWLLLCIYPIASATTKGGVNATRAACGLTVFPMIAGIGLATLLDVWIRNRHARPLRISAMAVVAAAIAIAGARFAHHLFAVWPQDAEVHARYQAEFREAMDYLRPRRDLFDQVFITDRRSMKRHWHTSEAYIYPLAYLPIPPQDFHNAFILEINPPGTIGFHRIARFGDFTFSINPDAMKQFLKAVPTGDILFIARPGEVIGGQVVQSITRPAVAPGQPPQRALELITIDLTRDGIPTLPLHP